jgi:hypothetical protein
LSAAGTGARLARRPRRERAPLRLATARAGRRRARRGRDRSPSSCARRPSRSRPCRRRAGVLERFKLTPRHLAVACASHGGDGQHLSRVAEILLACGVGESALGCGPLAPRDPSAAAALPGPPHRIHHNCSGKHALGLALCVREGWPLEGYLDAGHPLQDAMRAAILEATGDRRRASPTPSTAAGCAPTRRARAPRGGVRPRSPPAASGPQGARVAAGDVRHPALVGFPGSIDTELMAAAPGVVAKIGAEAVIAIGRRRPRARVKVLDGNGPRDRPGRRPLRPRPARPAGRRRAARGARRAADPQLARRRRRDGSTRRSAEPRRQPGSAASSSAGGRAELAELVTRIPTRRP